MRFTVFALLLTCTYQLTAQLNPGDIMFVGFNADGNDGFSILSLVDLPANTTVYFTDNEWNGSPIGAGGAFNNTNEGELTWTTGPAIITAGTVVNFLETNNAGNAGYGASVGSISGIINLNASNEVLYAFLGTNDSSPTTFLSAIANGGFNTANGTLTNTGLSPGVNATEITGDEDVMVYNGNTSCNTTVADCAAMIATPSNWVTQDGGGDQSADATAPDFPSDVPLFFGGSALPVDLLFFKAKETEKGILIFWETANEINNDYFELYRASDGEHFEAVAKIQGYGNSSSVHRYEFLDRNLPHNKHLFYRLRQVDFDGKFVWFDTILISRNITDHPIMVYPNPVTNGYFFFNSFQPVRSVEVLSLEGKLCKQLTNPKNNSMDISGLQAGNYVVRIATEHKVFISRIVVK